MAYIDVINDFCKTFGFPFDDTTSAQDMRLFLDSFIHFKGEAFVKDYTEIIYARINLKQPK